MNESPKVHRGPSPGHEDQWFVAKGIIGSSLYLHTDGQWRRSTMHEGEFTGYFRTQEAAQKALDEVTSS